MCFLTCVILRFTSGVTPADFIEVSIAAKLLIHILADDIYIIMSQLMLFLHSLIILTPQGNCQNKHTLHYDV